MVLGTLLVIVGVLLVLSAILPFSIPIGKLLLAFFLIYLGITMLLPSGVHLHFGHSFSDRENLVFTSGTLRPATPASTVEEFSIVFSKGTVDLKGMTLEKGSADVTVNVVFGDGIVEIPSSVPVTVESSAIFGSANTSSILQPKGTDKALHLKIHAVFGSVNVVRKNEK